MTQEDLQRDVEMLTRICDHIDGSISMDVTRAALDRAIETARVLASMSDDQRAYMATATPYLVYEMREHALRRERDAYEGLLAKKVTHLVRRSDGKRLYHEIDEDIHSTGGAWVFGEDIVRFNEERNARRVSVRDLNRRAQAAESRAIRAERDLATQVATLQARLDGAIREMDAKRVEEHVRRVRESNPNVRIPDVALEATSGGNRQAERLDMDRQYDHVFQAAFAPDLAWRGVTEQAENPLRIPEMLADFAHDVAERDARIATLEAFVRRVASGGTIVSSNALTPTQIVIARAADRMHIDDDGLGYVYVPGPLAFRGSIADMDEDELRAVISSQSTAIYDLRIELEEAQADEATAMIAATEAIARAERLEAVIARARQAIENRYDKAETAWDACNCVLAILAGKDV